MSKPRSLLLGAMVLATSAQAAQVCTGQSGIYGAVTVTRSGSCINLNDVDGFVKAASVLTSGSPDARTCSFTFSPAVLTAQLSAKLGGVDPGGADMIGLRLNGSSYSLLPTDINTTLKPPNSAGHLSLSSNQVVSTAFGGGTVFFGNTAASTTSTIDFVKAGTGSITLQVCFDDAPPTTPAAIPVLGQWATAVLAGMMAVFAFVWSRRRS